MEKRIENLYKLYLSAFDTFKRNASKKDKYQKELKECYNLLKDSSVTFSEPENLKSFSDIFIYALDSNNLKIVEKALLTLDTMISHELIDSKILREMVKTILNQFYAKSMLYDDNINYKILNLCIILYTSKLVNIYGVNLINIFKVCLNIFLSSKNQNCQNMAKLTLIQLVDYMIERLENVYSVNQSKLSIVTLISNSKILKNDPSSNPIPGSNSVNEMISNKDLYKESNTVNEYNLLMSKYLNYYIDLIVINSTNPKYEGNFIKKFVGFLNNSESSIELSKLIESQGLDDVEMRNENETKIGKYGWCINCRNAASFFSDKIRFPICSNECEVEILKLNKLIDIDVTVDSANCKDDYINALKILSKLSIREPKQQNYIEQINLKLREFCLELIQSLIQKGAKFFLTDMKLIQVIKESTIDSLIKNTLSNEMNIFKLSLNLFLTIISNYREHLKEEIEIFINRVLITILESENLGFSYKEIILDCMMRLAENCNFLVEIYINYDCDIDHKSIFYDLINLMTKIIQGMYKRAKYIQTFKPLQEANLRIKCLDFLTVFIKNLTKIVEENNKSSINNMIDDVNNKNILSTQPNESNQNDVLYEEEITPTLFVSEPSLVEIKDKINNHLKMKVFLSKAIDKFNINPKNAFNFLKLNDWLPSESSFKLTKEKILNSTIKKINADENQEDHNVNNKSGFSDEGANREDKDDNSNPLTGFYGNFYYNYQYILSSMDKLQLENLEYEDFLAREIVRFVKSNLKEINKSALGSFLCAKKDLNEKVLKHFINTYNYRNFHILEAMRILFSDFNLEGESQIIDRILQKFGEKYNLDNPTVFKNPDIAYYISFSILMLQTDMHREEVQVKMSENIFISNFYNLCSKEDVDQQYLSDCFYRVQINPIVMPGQKLNLQNKNKKDLIKMEKESILKSTYEELQNKNLISNHYISIIDNDHIRNLIETSWSNFLGIFSQLLADFDEESIVNTCIDNILNVARMCGILRLDNFSEAFINTIVNMTNLMEGREIKQKNCDCTKALIEFAVDSGIYVRSCWLFILNIVSKVDYYHSIEGQFTNEAELFVKEIRRRSKLRNPEREIEIELKNTEIISKNIPLIFCDNIFSKTAMFDEEGIISFVSALCVVSKNELELFFNPRNYSLHKLVEVADFNIFRVQIEWAKIWKLISEHLVFVATNYNHDNICIDAIDSLRQIVIKLLQKSDLAVYNFQIDFFKPFEIIFMQSVNRSDRSELILTCVSFIVQNSKNIHSGWIVIFNILKQGLKRKDHRLNLEILKILQAISEDISVINHVNQEVFRGYIECLCHMYLDESLKKLAFETILKLMSKIFTSISNSTSNTNMHSQIDKKFEFLKLFFYGFDDLLRLNTIEHLNLLFEIISYNRDVLFSSDINSFIYVYYCFFKPHLVSLLFYYMDYRLNNFDFIKSQSNKLGDTVIFKELYTKNTLDDVYHNVKIYLEDSLLNHVELLETAILNDKETDRNANESNQINLKDSNFFELIKNGGVESKKYLISFLNNIIKCYDKDSDLIIKKLEILKCFELKNYETALEFFFEKFLNMIDKISDSYLNYQFFYEDLLSTLINLSIFNKNSNVVFKIFGKNIIATGDTLSNNCWKVINNQILFILNCYSSLKVNTSEQTHDNTIQFLYSFSNFLLDIISNFYNKISVFRNSILNEEYKIINMIISKLLTIDLENDFAEYKIVNSAMTLEILKTFSKIKLFILVKSSESEVKLSEFFDDSYIFILNSLNRIYKKYNLIEDDENEMIGILEYELQYFLPKFMKFFDEKELEEVFSYLLSMIDSRSTNLRQASKNVIQKFSSDKLIIFKSYNNNKD